MKNHSSNNGSCHSDLTDFSLYSEDYGLNSKTAGTAGSFTINQADLSSIGIPALSTGLLDNNLSESAYEVFLACMVCSGLEFRLTEGTKKEKSPRFLAGVKRREKTFMVLI